MMSCSNAYSIKMFLDLSVETLDFRFSSQTIEVKIQHITEQSYRMERSEIRINFRFPSVNLLPRFIFSSSVYNMRLRQDSFFFRDSNLYLLEK